jgi:ABC-2 type transport system permease protein
MAAPTETTGTPARKTRTESRRTERAPSGGWRTIAAKELADHIASWRFLVLLIVIAGLSILPMYFSSNDIAGIASQTSGSNPLVFLALFTHGASSFNSIPMIALVVLLVPLVGIAFGFDGINSERSQGTLSRLLAQPVHRDDVINGKFVAGITVILVMMITLILLVTAIGILRLGIIPTGEDMARVGVWLLTTVLYASFWLAFSLLLSVVIRSTATAALVGFGVWLAVSVVGSFLIKVAAGVLFPIDASASIQAQIGSYSAQQFFLRLSPAQLYQDVIRATLDPSTTTLFVTSSGQNTSAQQQIPSLLTLDQSILLVWPQFVALVALTVLLFAIAYVLFLRQEVRA